MDPAQALADLTEISSQIDAVVLLDGAGALLGSNIEDAERARRIAEGATRLLEEAAAAAAGHEPGDLSQLEAATPHGSVFVVREGGRTIAATTGPEPTVGLVFYDLKSCLRSLDAAAAAPAAQPEPAKPKPKPKRRSPPKAESKAKPKPKPKPRAPEEAADGEG